MRLIIATFCVVLLLLAVVGLGLGLFIFATVAAATPVGGGASLVAIGAAAPVLTLGAVSLGMLTIAMAVDHARADQTDAARSTTAVAAEHMRRQSPPRDPVLAARRARIAAEQEARIEAARDDK